MIFDGSTSTNPEDSVLTYSWNFGDGASGQGTPVTHIYTSPGSFTATLTVTDDSGATANTTTTIRVMIEDEQSLDDETRHSSETVGYFLFFSNSNP